MDHKPILPSGLPRDAKADDGVDQRVAFHLLEALDALDAVYGSAAYFAEVAAEASIGDYALARCLEAVRCRCGAMYLTNDDELTLDAERNGAAALLRREQLLAAGVTARPALHNGADARALLQAAAPDHHVLTCPVHDGNRLLGIVVLLAPPQAPFSAPDAKLVATVVSQAAIALSRVQHHHAAEVERQKLRLVVQNHSDGIVVLDADGTTTLCNPIARDYCGTTDVLSVLHAHDAGCTIDALGDGPTERELTIVYGAVRRAVLVKSRDVRDGQGKLANVVLMLRDVTEKRREERLKRDSLSLISHKLRTPLTALVCALQMMTTAEPGEQAAFIEEMQRRAQDLGTLIDRLLGFTELLGSWSKRGATDLRTLAGDLDAHFRAATHCAAPLAIAWDLQPDASLVPVPPSRLRVALINLIDNALKFSPQDRPWVRVASRRDGAAIAIEVEDRGPGIPAHERTNLFATFHQVETDFTGNVPGAGIGLAMVREITTRLGGTLDQRDAEPHGCVFTLTFPATPERSAP